MIVKVLKKEYSDLCWPTTTAMSKIEHLLEITEMIISQRISSKALIRLGEKLNDQKAYDDKNLTD